MSKGENGVTYSFNVCSQCRSICCQNAKPPLTINRKKILLEYLNKQKIVIDEPFSEDDYSYPAVDEELYCRLFDKKTGKCRVHPVKPETCIAGPVTFDINFRTKKVEFYLKKTEICAYAGVLYKNKILFDAHFKEAKKQIISLIEQLSVDELRAIVKIEEPQTFKFSEADLSPEIVKKLTL